METSQEGVLERAARLAESVGLSPEQIDDCALAFLNGAFRNTPLGGFRNSPLGGFRNSPLGSFRNRTLGPFRNFPLGFFQNIPFANGGWPNGAWGGFRNGGWPNGGWLNW
jgi:hypothetical protein